EREVDDVDVQRVRELRRHRLVVADEADVDEGVAQDREVGGLELARVAGDVADGDQAGGVRGATRQAEQDSTGRRQAHDGEGDAEGECGAGQFRRVGVGGQVR